MRTRIYSNHNGLRILCLLLLLIFSIATSPAKVNGNDLTAKENAKNQSTQMAGTIHSNSLAIESNMASGNGSAGNKTDYFELIYKYRDLLDETYYRQLMPLYFLRTERSIETAFARPKAANEPGKKLTKLTVGVQADILSAFKDPQAPDKLLAIKKHLEQNANVDITMHLFRTPEEMEFVFNKNKIDILIAHKNIYKRLYAQGKVVPFLTVSIKGKDNQRLCFYTCTDSPITTLEQTAGRCLGYFSAEDLAKIKEGFAARNENESFENHFGEIKEMKNADAGLMELYFGSIDIIAGPENLIAIEKNDFPGIEKQKKIRGIAEISSIPNDPIFIKKSVAENNQNLTEEIKKILLGLHREPVGKELIQYLQIDKFLPFQEDKYKRDLLPE